MAWPSLTANDVRSGRGAKTIGLNLYDRQQIVVTRGTTWYFAETVMTTTLADVNTQYWRIPSWCTSGAVISLIFRAKRDGAVSGNCNFRLRETGVPTNGSTLNTAITTSFASYTVTLTVPDDTWAGTVKTLALQAQRPASGVDADWDIECANLMTNFAFGAG